MMQEDRSRSAPIPVPPPRQPFPMGSYVTCDLPLRGRVHGTVCGDSSWSMIHIALLNGDIVRVHVGSLRRISELPVDEVMCFAQNYRLATAP